MGRCCEGVPALGLPKPKGKVGLGAVPQTKCCTKAWGMVWPTGILPHQLLEPRGSHPHGHSAGASRVRSQCCGAVGDKRLKAPSQPAAAVRGVGGGGGPRGPLEATVLPAEQLGCRGQRVRLGLALQSVQKWHFRFSDASWKP